MNATHAPGHDRDRLVVDLLDLGTASSSPSIRWMRGVEFAVPDDADTDASDPAEVRRALADLVRSNGTITVNAGPAGHGSADADRLRELAAEASPDGRVDADAADRLLQLVAFGEVRIP